MVCLIKNQYKKELSHYASILGSEEAAYYVLAMNNGYTLDMNPDGSPSELFMALTLANGMDEDAAILSKSVVYTPLYTDKYGDWTENFDSANGSAEPSIVTLNNDLLLCDNSAIKSILSDPAITVERLIDMEYANQLDRDPVISQALRDERELYVLERLDDFILDNPSATQEELDREANIYRKAFNFEKLNKVRYSLIEALHHVFGRTVRWDDLNLKYVGTDAFSNILANILNTLDKNLFDSTGFVSEVNQELEFTIVTLLRQLILGVEPETLLRTVIESYLRMFANSLPMQEAFKLLAKDYPNRSIDSMIREIANHVTGDVYRTSLKRAKSRKIEDFWNKFKNFLRKITPKIQQKDYNTKRNILDSITAYFAILQDLDDAESEELMFDIRMWNTKTYDIKTNAKDVVARIKSGIESRIKSILSVTKENFNQLELLTLLSWLDDIEKLDLAKLSKMDDELYLFIDKFLVYGLLEIHDAAVDLINIKDKDVAEINASQLMRIKTDVVGFYESLITQQLIPLARTSLHELILPGGIVSNAIKIIDNALLEIKHEFDLQLERYCDHVVDKFVDEYVDVGNKERFRINAKLHLRNKINNGELAFLDKYFSSGVSSQSPIVRMLDTYLRESRLAAHQSALRAKELWKLYKACTPATDSISFKNFMREFCEVDDEGNLTGNFVSEVNVGLFNKRLNEGIKLLDKKYNIEFDEDGHRKFESEEQWRDYQDDKDDLIEQIGGHRRYIAEYYKDRRRFLSRGTIEMQLRIRRDIDKILAKCTEELKVNGKPTKVQVEAKLSLSDKQRLADLRKQQELLGNLYDMVYDVATGKIIDIREKTGEALLVAKEITAWNNYKKNYLKHKSNNKQYADVRQALIDKYGADSYEVKLFEYRNSVLKLSDQYYTDLFLALTPGVNSENRAMLLAKRKSILDACRERKGYYEPNLDLLSTEAFAELKRIDEALNADPVTGGLFDEEAYYNLVKENYVKKQGTNQTYFEWLRELYAVMALTDPNAMNLFYDRFMYTKIDKKGNKKFVPLSCFSYNGPIDEDKYVEIGATGLYIDIDESSYYYDNMYDESNDDFILPDKQTYRNHLYDKIDANDEMRAFYEKLILTMDEIWSLLPNISRLYRYQMPQRRGEVSRLILRKGFLKNVKSIAQQTFLITERDTDYNEEFTRRPDGSIVETIPMRWVHKLDDPNTIDTNIIGSVAAMLEMALQFNMKLLFVPIMEAVNFLLYGGFSGIGQNSTDLADRFKSHMSMYMYGRMRSGFRKFKKMSKVERGLQKTFQTINSVAWSKLMIHNWNSVMKNAVDSFWSLMAEASGGKYFAEDDLRAAAKICFGRDLVKLGPLSSLSNIALPTLTANLMLYNRVSGSIDDIFDGAELSWVRRTLRKTKTGEYTAVDYLFKGLITEAIYHTYRLITNPSTGKQEFMNKELALYAYVKIGATNEDGLKAYNNATVTLRDAYYADENNIVLIKDLYIDIVKPIVDESTKRRSRKLETRISSTILERCSVINGMLDEMDKNVVSLNYIGATFLMMRGWLLAQQIDYNKRGHDFAIYADGSDLLNSNSADMFKKISNYVIDAGATLIIQEDENYSGQFNFATGTVDKGAWVNLLSAYKQWVKSGMYLRHMFNSNKMTSQQKYAVSRMNTCIFSVMMLSLLTFLFGVLRESDPDDWVYAYLFNMAISSISERTSQLGHIALIFVLSDLMQTPAVATALIRDIKYIPQALFDLVSVVYDWASGGDKNIEAYETVKKGTYKNRTKVLRNLLKASSEIPGVNSIGVDNMYKNFSMDAIESKGDWFAQIAPTPIVSYIPQLGSTKKKLTGIWGLMLDEHERENNKRGFLQKTKNVLKGWDDAGESGTTQRSKKKSKKKSKKTKLPQGYRK